MILKTLHKISKQYASKWLVITTDLSIVIFTFFAAYIIHFNFKIEFDVIILLKQIPIVIAFAFISFLLVASHRSVVRFTGYKDIINLIIGINILATLLIISTFFSRKYHFDAVFDISGSIIYTHLLLNVLFLVGFRLFIKTLYNNMNQNENTQINVLIFGAGSSGILTYDTITNDTKTNYQAAGFIDDNPSKINKKINLIRVHHLNEITKAFVLKFNIEEVIISIQNIAPSRLLQITEHLFTVNVKTKIVPPVQQWINGDLSIGQIKEVKIEDLLGREQIFISNPELTSEYEDETILITGAAGSIGSEISRKLTQYNYKQLILIDASESALYDLQQELKQQNAINYNTIVANVRDRAKMELLFKTYNPTLIFHAAAYKHVPLMENSPYEAIKTNLKGTINIASLAITRHVKKFILISTDKAVNPTNVMGATKRIAELYINCLQNRGNTKFITTRFGNVLGSNGSVVPLFKKQIEYGGPITVTHKDITRYFMTIPEACQLVLEAATMGNGGEIFVFDMGKPVKIIDLAKSMIALSGLNYPNDITIKIIGLRPGEKIYEELLADGEHTKPTYHEKIMIAKVKPLKIQNIEEKINELSKVTATTKNLDIVSLIKAIIPEYISNNSMFEVLDNQPHTNL